jgi:hypothetical protein
MLAELYKCDRNGCTSETEALGRGDFFYSDPNWIGVMVRGLSEPDLKRKDFCTLECLGMWIDTEIAKRRR